jgi:Domain of unknown function (DUF4338)
MLIDTTPINAALADIRPVSLEPVRKTADEPLFNSLMEQHHYLGYEQPVGEHLCELNKVNPFDYLTELLRQEAEPKARPAEWMPWNYRQTLQRIARPAAA